MERSANHPPKDFWQKVKKTIGKTDALAVERKIGPSCVAKIYTLFLRHVAENGTVIMEQDPRTAVQLAIQAAVFEVLHCFSSSIHMTEPTKFRESRELPFDPDLLRKIAERATQRRTRRPKHIADRLEHLQNVGWIQTTDE